MPTELTTEQLAAIRARNRVNKELEIPHVEYPHCPYCNHIPALLSHADALAAKVARLEGDLEEAIRLLSSGLQVAIGKLPPLPETEPVRALCEKHGYGAVMHMAEFLWFEKDGAGGNHSTGHCYSTIKRFIDRVKGTV